MACYDASPYVCTYDSGGNGSLPGGGNPDYSSLAVWEPDTDINYSAGGYTHWLDCYDSQVHNDTVEQVGATTSEDQFRGARGASACSTAFAGKSSTGPAFESSAAGTVWYINEARGTIKNMSFKNTVNQAGASHGAYLAPTNQQRAIACVFYEGSNAGGGVCDGIYVQTTTDVFLFACISRDQEGDGFIWFWGNNPNLLCNTAYNNGDMGFMGGGAGLGNGANLWSNYGMDNSTSDFQDTSNNFLGGGWNASKDTSSDMNGDAGDNYKNSLTLNLDSDGLLQDDVSTSGSGGAGDNYGRNPYDDFSGGITDLENFLKNDEAGWDESRQDIKGNDRPTPTTADVAWAVGAHEFSAEASATVVPVVFIINS